MDNANEMFVEQLEQELSHIYDLLHTICTFKKVKFTAEDSGWKQNANGNYYIKIACQDYVALAAFEQLDEATDRRVSMKADIESKFATITSQIPFDGYIIAINGDFDDESAFERPYDSNLIETGVLSATSNNAVSSKVVYEAIADLKKQAYKIPTTLPASDVYEWAKKETKPEYDWSEIKNVPTNHISSLKYGNTSYVAANGVVELDDFVESLNIPKKLGDITDDIGIARKSEVATSINELQTNINVVSHNADAKITELTNRVQDLGDNSSSYRASISQLDGKYTNLSTRLETYKTTSDADLTSAITLTKAELQSSILNLASKITEVEYSLQNAKTELETDISGVAHEHRLFHDRESIIIKEICADIAELRSITADYSGVTVAELNTVRNTANANKITIDSLNTSVASNANTITTLSNDVSSLTNTVSALGTSTQNQFAGINSEVQNVKSELAENSADVANIENTIATIQTKVQTNKNNIELVATSVSAVASKADANNAAIKVLEERLDKLPDEIEVEDNVATGILVERSFTNGNIVVKTPKRNAENKVVRDEYNNVVYISTEVPVYQHIIPDEVVTEDELSTTIESLTSGARIGTRVDYDGDGNQNISIANVNGGILWVNGTNVTFKSPDAQVFDLQETVTAQAATIQAQNVTITNLQTTVNNFQTTINQLQQTINEMQTNIINVQNFIGDDNGILEPEKGEKTLMEKQNADTAITDEDALAIDDIADIFNSAK